MANARFQVAKASKKRTAVTLKSRNVAKALDFNPTWSYLSALIQPSKFEKLIVFLDVVKQFLVDLFYIEETCEGEWEAHEEDSDNERTHSVELRVQGEPYINNSLGYYKVTDHRVDVLWVLFNEGNGIAAYGALRHVVVFVVFVVAERSPTNTLHERPTRFSLVAVAVAAG